MSESTDNVPLRLSMRAIAKSYGAVHALNDVGFELRPGEVMALLGENGAGKSTLVKVLGGLVREDSGEILIDGEPVVLNSSRRSQAAGVAVVHQEYSSVDTMSVAENLVLGQVGTGTWWIPSRLRRAARELLGRVGLGDLDPRKLVSELSVAERQLLELARVLQRDAKIVIFDEPTAALSDTEIDRVLDVVRQMASEGRSVVYVTHRLPEVFRVADRITVFRNGTSLPPIPTAEVDTDGVVQMMLGRELSAMFPDRTSAVADVVLDIDGLVVPGLRAPVSLTVRRGEILGLTGMLGSGALATARGLAGEHPVIAGEVLLEGRPQALRNRREGIDSGIAYCSSDRKRDGIFAGRSVKENLSSPWLASIGSRGVLSRRAERAQAQEVCEAFHLDVGRLGSATGNLSGGNQQKVALGKWLGTNPKVLVVEEPTRGVDVGARAEIYAQLRRLCDSGLAVVVASSDTAEILGVSDTIATFYHGRMNGVRSHEEWTEEELVRAVMHTEVAA